LIGVFDSGSGGLTVMRALEQALPDQAFIYLGDHGNAPYGHRSPEEIYRLTLQSLERLFGLGCSLIVVACNTAAATGLRQLQRTWLPDTYPDRRVIGVIVPVVEEVTGVPWDADAGSALSDPPPTPVRVAVFATEHTVRTRAYVGEIEKRAPSLQIDQQACPGLVALIEQAAPEPILRAAVRGHVGALLDAMQGTPDICILGCTHYPLIEQIFADELPGSVRLLSQPSITAGSLTRYLERHPRHRRARQLPTQFFTTGSADQASTLATRFYGRPISFTAL
jgi:glutamate racemase